MAALSFAASQLAAILILTAVLSARDMWVFLTGIITDPRGAVITKVTIGLYSAGGRLV